jgi:hypothetical protein
LRHDLLVIAANFEELSVDYFVAFVTTSFPCEEHGTCEETTMFMLPKHYDPTLDGGKYGAELIRRHYTEESN